MVFDNLNDFIAHDKLADAVIISHYDLLHYDTAQVLLVKGYDVLVETPVANSLDGLVHLKEYSLKKTKTDCLWWPTTIDTLVFIQN